jgi:hypothetical protein
MTARRTRVAPLALAGLLAAGCRGPRPEVESYDVSAGAPGTIVSVVVANRSGGEGRAGVEVTLRAEGRIVAREERTLALYAHERATLLVPVPIPYRHELAVEVRTRYPVD